MRNINVLMIGWMLLFSINSMAITIDEMAEKNNKIIELDQDIAIAERTKKLAQLKNESIQPETITLPKAVLTRRDESISVLSVHGAPTDPVVDVQFGDHLLYKRRGDVLPDGSQITAIGHNSVTFNKKGVDKTVSIGHGGVATSDITAPSH